jgi:hypothetical protein
MQEKEQPFYQIIVPETLAKLAVSKRAINGKYAKKESGYLVVTHVQYLAFFCMLKSLTKSGYITNYHEQIEELKAVTNLAKSTIYSYINECKKMDLLKVTRNQIQLVKWTKACELFDIPCERFVNVTYQLNNPLHKPRYILSIAEQKANIHAQAYMSLKKFVQSYYPDNSEAHIKAIMKLAVDNPTALVKAALEKRKNWITKFQNGVDNVEPESVFGDVPADYFLMENRHLWRGTRGMLKAFGLNPAKEKNPRRKRTITYYKHQLERRGLATIKRENKVFTEVTGYRPATHEKVIFDNLEMKHKIEKIGIRSVFLPNDKKVGIWFPDAIIPADMFQEQAKTEQKTEHENTKTLQQPNRRKAA